MARYQACSIILDDNEFEIADGPSFYMMHREIYGDQSYLFRSQRDAPVIIDCGSNYGVSILWFKKNYPDAKIVGVEADPAVFVCYLATYLGVTFLMSSFCIELFRLSQAIFPSTA